jgi:hypothetical protein
LSSIVDVLGHLGHCLSWASLQPLLKALHHIHTHFCDITHCPYISTNWWWISTIVTPFLWKDWITQYISTFDHVLSRPVILKLIVWWYGMLMVPSHGCMMTQMSYICLLHGEIHGQMMVFYVRHAVTIFCETPLHVSIVKGIFICRVCHFVA